MKRYIIIDRSIGDSDYYCRCSLVKEHFGAKISGDDLLLFRDGAFISKYPDACPFLREKEEGKFHCTIYPSRPGHCRRFECDRIKHTG